MMVAHLDDYEQFKQIAATYSPNFYIYWSPGELTGSFRAVGITGSNQIAFMFEVGAAETPPTFNADFPTGVEVPYFEVS
jgi:hypothetical protein